MKKASLYVKGGERDAGYYYRFYQFFREIDVKLYVHKMYSDKTYQRFLPIGNKPLLIKVLLWLLTVARVTMQLVFDMIKKPQTIIISRRLVPKRTPRITNFILTTLSKKGVNVIWDFDDNIVASKECDEKSFEILCRISSHIIIASPYLKSLIPCSYQGKVVELPTVDGQTEEEYSHDLLIERLNSFQKVIKVIWLGTQVSLPYVSAVLPRLKEAATTIQDFGKKMELIIVSDKGLNIEEDQSLLIRNVSWTREIALAELRKAHIGIMPLEVNEFTEGKGGFKLLQYISIGLPVVVTSVGINKNIVDDKMGFQINALGDSLWRDSIVKLAKDKEAYISYSINSRKSYEEHFSFNKNLSFWRGILLS